MTETTADPRIFEVDQFYPHPPQRVWRALTTPELMARWLMESTGFVPVVGTRFTFHTEPMPAADFSGEIACEVIELVDGERLTISWTDARTGRPDGWLVSWTLRAEGRGTRVILRHSGFDPADELQRQARTIMGNGWVRIAGRLGSVLDDYR